MIGVAIIGVGIGADHLKGYLALPEYFSVKAVCDLDLDRARRVVGDNSSIRITTSLEDVLADDDVALVDICLPPHLHCSVALRAQAAGKDVICEKPLVRSLEEVQALVASSEKTGRHIFPVFQYRYGHAMRQLQALMKAGLAGKPYVASIEVHWDRDADYYAIPWRGTWKGECGGAILGHAIHFHDLLCHVLGPVGEVFAFADTRVNAIETEDCAAVSFRMMNGALATSSITLGSGDNSSRLRFCFEGFTAESDVESNIFPYRPAEAPWRFIARAPITQDQIDGVLSGVDDGHSSFAGFLESVAEAIQGRAGKEVTLAEGKRSIELVTAIYASIHRGAPVRLPLAATDAMFKGWTPIETQSPK